MIPAALGKLDRPMPAVLGKLDRPMPAAPGKLDRPTKADFGKLNRMTDHPLDARAKTRKKALETAQQFEDVMVRTFVSAMRQTAKIDDESSGMFGSGPGADTFADWFDEKIAHEVSSSGRVGVANVLMQEFERWKQVPTDANAAAAGSHATDPSRKHAQLPKGLLDVDPASLQPLHLPTAPHGGIDVAV